MYAVIPALKWGFGVARNLDLGSLDLSEIETSADCGSGSGVIGVRSGEVLF